MNYIKEAFNKVKQDIDLLKNELNNLKYELKENRELIAQVCENIQKILNQISSTYQQNKIEYGGNLPTHQQIDPTYKKNIPADITHFNHLNAKNLVISTGNQGVPADRQTDQQTDQQTENNIENAAEMINSLDNLRKEIYKKFKKLTEQEWIVFSTIYQFDEEKGYSNYQILAEKLKLTESSIRDYVARLIKKGIPINKSKLNNKNIRLNISQSLKQIASLSTIVSLRDL
mgnify:FL=1